MSELKKYDHQKVEKKWQETWEMSGLYTPDLNSANKKFYNLWMFPYPSAEGLHAGHAFASTGSDAFGRYMRMQGMSVFQPIGYDSFGIHSENFAIKVNETPQEMLARTTKNYAHQLKTLGHAYDWTRTVTTSESNYYRWTQWLFVQMFKNGLAYRKSASVNWCPSCKTVLSDEQVINGECERCGSKVEMRQLPQWFFRITDYAEKLLQNLDKIDWTEKVKIAQRNWIGKTEGINITYKIEDTNETVTCWTSRPDTNFGATFIVLAPESPLIDKIITSNQKLSVQQYVESSAKKSKEERIEEGKKKTGVFTGAYAINNLNGERLPIWVSDFVLAEVGTGAVVGVPGHDMRDFEFAKEFGIQIRRVVVGKNGDKDEISRPEQVQEKEGKMMNSQILDGMDILEAKVKIMEYLVEKGWGVLETNYHLRDWLISRQRYWGPPIPMIYCETCAKKGISWLTQNKAKLHNDHSDWEHAGWFPEDNLPVELPKLVDYKPKGTGRGPLDDHPEFYKVNCPHCGAIAKRETDVSDTFLDSSWYFLRYPSTDSIQNRDLAWDPDITKKWLPVDLYFGGAEHSVLHLMYARFVTQMLYDMKLVDFDEPFPKFFAHGLMIKDGAKMSKSRGNVVNPDVYIEKFGADTLRLYLMFMGPMDGYPDFRDTGIEGMRKFVNRLWGLLSTASDKDKTVPEEVRRKLHQTIKKVTEDIKEYRYNTSIAALMEYANILKETNCRAIQAIEPFVQLLAPFAPHLTEEIWREILHKKESIHISTWPTFDESLLENNTVVIPVQVNGKLRTTLTLSNDEAQNKDTVEKKAREAEAVARHLGSQTIKTVFVPGKLINFVVKP